ncbi:class I SAM-dependent methyltransferase [Enemella evansiae]|uniref:class I SAM-dependent methyltransferase n=1 Tax=Enemella evansiae TaxID=2016499 RepID=UPI0015956CA5|nr:class I SAM-dependent methyltransferase [Enemella evansiae]
MYGSEYAAVYDAVMKSRARDYAGMAHHISGLIDEALPQARTLLDVGAGTGIHARHWVDGFDVTMADASAEMLDYAHEQVPEASTAVFTAPAVPDTLGVFDAVVCLFMIPHLSDEDAEEFFRAISPHISSGGLLIIEPWYSADNHIDHYVGFDTLRTDEWAVARLSHSVRRDQVVEVTVHHAKAQPESGIAAHTETARLHLRPLEWYGQALERAGFTGSFVEPNEALELGLWVGTKP